MTRSGAKSGVGHLDNNRRRVERKARQEFTKRFERFESVYEYFLNQKLGESFATHKSKFFAKAKKWQKENNRITKLQYDVFNRFNDIDNLEFKELNISDDQNCDSFDIKARPNHVYFKHIDANFIGEQRWKRFCYIPYQLSESEETVSNFLDTYSDIDNELLLLTTLHPWQPEAVKQMIEYLFKNPSKSLLGKKELKGELIKKMISFMFPQKEEELNVFLHDIGMNDDTSTNSELEDSQHNKLMSRASRICKFCGKYDCISHPEITYHKSDFDKKIKLIQDDRLLCREIDKYFDASTPKLQSIAESKNKKCPKQMATRKHRYTPCYHPQEKFRNCTFINCSCIRSGMRCEPACACYKPSYTTLDKEQRSTANDYIYSSRCSNAFIGCCCSEQQCLIESCTCRMKNQECNPKSCSCCTESENGQCGNMMLQKLDAAFSQGKRPFNLPKLQLFSTKSAGYGVKAVEKIMAGQFIQEYVGERIDNNESERRGLICDSEALSYIFNCNEDEAIDSQSYGNISRFINHSNQPNCQTTVLYVNGEDRVAIFAIQNINIGEELNFDYNYSPTHQEIHFSCCN